MKRHALAFLFACLLAFGTWEGPALDLRARVVAHLLTYATHRVAKNLCRASWACLFVSLLALLASLTYAVADEAPPAWLAALGLPAAVALVVEQARHLLRVTNSPE